MEQKNIVATIYLKNGQAVKGIHDFTPVQNVYELARLYNDSGIDKIVIFDLSDDDEEHEKNLHTIKNIFRNVELKLCAGGNINRMDDVKKLIYAGCRQVIFNGAKPDSMEIAKEACRRFGKERLLVSLENVDFIFKHQNEIHENFHELLVLNTHILDAIENIADIAYIVNFENCDYEKLTHALQRKNIRGIAGNFINDPHTDIMELKSRLSMAGIKMDNFEPALKWADLKPNADGLIPVIVQDYRTDQVLMLSHMNEEAFDTTIHTGRMTYFDRNPKGMGIHADGLVQYVKSLTADTGCAAILAKVSEVDVTYHRESETNFTTEIVAKEYMEKNPLKVLEDVYAIILDRRANPKEGSYTNYLFDKGLDKILLKIAEEATEIVIAAKNPEAEEIKYKISDLLYHLMVLMAEKGVTWEEITQELSQR